MQSLSDLLNVQNDFLSVWVNYEVQRMALEFDLGVMELDAAGLRREQWRAADVLHRRGRADSRLPVQCLGPLSGRGPSVRGRAGDAANAGRVDRAAGRRRGAVDGRSPAGAESPVLPPAGTMPGSTEPLPIPPPSAPAGNGAQLTNPAAAVTSSYEPPLVLPPPGRSP